MADIKISQLYAANLIGKNDQLPIIVATGASAPCQWNTRRATVETIVSGGFNGSPMSQSIANNILQASASLSVVNLWTSSLSQSVQTINFWTSSLSSSVQTINFWTSSLSQSVLSINAWTGSNLSRFPGTASLALSSSYVFNLQEVTTAGNQTSQSIQITASLANGLNIFAVGNYSHAEGERTTTAGAYSHAEGQFTTAIGQGSHAEGLSTLSIGANSHAEGGNTTAIGIGSHAEGQLSTALGNYSHAEGWQTIAAGAYSHAEGALTRAIGGGSHAEGYQTTALGNYSKASGLVTVALADYQNVVGQYNIPSPGNSAFIIGNGAAGAPSNLLYADNNEVKVNGKIEVTGSLDVLGPVNISSSIITLPLLGNYINDTSAAGGGIPIGGLYRNGNVISIRVS